MEATNDVMVVSSATGKVLHKVNDFRESGKFCDVKIVVDKETFPVHKAILAGFSPYFEAMFAGNFVEAQQDTIHLESFDVSIMKVLLEYAYTNKITITSGNAQELLHAASFFQVEELFEPLCQFLVKNLRVENCISIHSLAIVYSCLQLADLAKKFKLSNFPAVSNTVEFLELDANAVLGIIEDDSLSVVKEEIVFDAVLRWFHYKEDERRADLGKVLSHVRLAFLDPSFLHSRVRASKALQETESVAKLLDQVMLFHLAPKRKAEVYSTFTKRRHCSPQLEVLLYLGRCLKTSKYKLLFVTEDGMVRGEMPLFYPYICNSWWSAFNYEMHTLALADNRIIEYWDVEENTWKFATKLKQPFRNRCLIQKVDGQWYSFGDSSTEKDNGPLIQTLDVQSSTFLNSNTDGPERYNAATRKWEKIAPLLERAVNADIVSLHGLIYVVGGEDKGKNGSNRIQSYDPVTNTWTHVTSLPSPRKRPRVCGLNGCIYVFSGKASNQAEELGDRRVDMYDLFTNVWKRCADIPFMLCPGDLTEPIVSGGHIYVVTSPPGLRFKLQVYSTSKDSWTDFNEVPGTQVLVVRGPILMKHLL